MPSAKIGEVVASGIQLNSRLYPTVSISSPTNFPHAGFPLRNLPQWMHNDLSWVRKSSRNPQRVVPAVHSVAGSRHLQWKVIHPIPEKTAFVPITSASSASVMLARRLLHCC